MRASLLLVLSLLVLRPEHRLVAQENEDSTAAHSVRLGLTVGMSAATFNVAKGAAWSHRMGIVPGIEASVALARHVYFEPGLRYTMRGARYTDLLGQQGSLALNYIALPLLVRAELPALRRVTPFVNGGPAISYRTNCSVEYYEPGYIRQTCHAYDRRPASGGITERRRIDVAAVAGGGLAIPVAGQQAKLGAQYEWGLRRLNPEVSTRHRAWSVLATIEWRLP